MYLSRRDGGRVFNKGRDVINENAVQSTLRAFAERNDMVCPALQVRMNFLRKAAFLFDFSGAGVRSV